jgi:hypothetical protein
VISMTNDHQAKILLVEGESDKTFFTLLLSHLKLDVEVSADTPTTYGAQSNGKTQALRRLPPILGLLESGKITHIALVVDADYPAASGLGYIKTVTKIHDVIQPYGYQEKEISQEGNGFSFRHTSEKIKPFGLWVISHNQTDGMFEDWLKTTVSEAEKSYLTQAITAVDALPNKRFKLIHGSKAHIATWQAWQTLPANNLTIEQLDFSASPMQQLVGWLRKIYEN